MELGGLPHILKLDIGCKLEHDPFTKIVPTYLNSSHSVELGGLPHILTDICSSHTDELGLPQRWCECIYLEVYKMSYVDLSMYVGLSGSYWLAFFAIWTMFLSVICQYGSGNTQFVRFRPVTLVPFEPNLINYDLLDDKQVNLVELYNTYVYIIT